MNGSFWSEETLAGLYWLIDWIILYQMDRIVLDVSYRICWIVLYRFDRIISAGPGNTVFYALAGYWLDGTDGTDGLDGKLVVRGWDGQELSGAGTGAPPLALEGRRPMGSGGWQQLCWCCKDAEYFYWRRKIIQIYCTGIAINT